MLSQRIMVVLMINVEIEETKRLAAIRERFERRTQVRHFQFQKERRTLGSFPNIPFLLGQPVAGRLIEQNKDLPRKLT